MNILFVCTGNTCRSPMAEALFNDMVQKKGLEGFKAASAGLAALSGQDASMQAVQVMKEMGIDLKGHKSRQVDEALLKQADLILTMTQGHKNALQAAEPSIWKKVYTLKEYAGLQDKDIQDPFGQPVEVYRRAAREISQALERLLEKIEKE